jgi:uncharacterized protein (TIRG00374 family)
MPKKHKILFRREYLALLIIVIIAIIILPQLKAFSGSLNKLNNVNMHLAFYATLFTLGSYFAAAGTYYFLAIKNIKYGITVFVQFAAMFINRLLPAGIGALGLNYGYLKKHGHNNVQSATIVSLNNLFGFIGNSIIVLIAILLTGIKVPSDSLFHNNWLFLLLFLPGLLVLIYFLINPLRRSKLLKTLTDIKLQLIGYSHKPSKLLSALLSSSALSLCNFISVFICAHAVGGSVSMGVVVVVYSLGIGLGASIPTPGGLGGVEAGMVAGFVAFGLPASTALAAVILYRLISFWFVLIIGAIAFFYVQKLKLIRFRSS